MGMLKRSRKKPPPPIQAPAPLSAPAAGGAAPTPEPASAAVASEPLEPNTAPVQVLSPPPIPPELPEPTDRQEQPPQEGSSSLGVAALMGLSGGGNGGTPYVHGHVLKPMDDNDERERAWRRESGLCELTGKRPERCRCGGPGCLENFSIEDQLHKAIEAYTPPAPVTTKERRRTEHNMAAWKAFVDSVEIGPTLKAYARIRRIYRLPRELSGLAAFDALVAAAEPTMTVRVREMCKVLSKQIRRRREGAASTGEAAPLSVVISGAGPVGLRCAVECALFNMDVTVIEKRETFSRVNILTLWPQVPLPLPRIRASAPHSPIFRPRPTSPDLVTRDASGLRRRTI